MALNIAQMQAGVPSAFDQAMQGYQMGTNVRLQREQEQQAKLQAEQQAARKVAVREAMGGLAEKFRDGSASIGDVMQTIEQAPEFREQLIKGYEMYEEDKQQGILGNAFATASALINGDTDIAMKQLDQGIEAAKNEGDERMAAGMSATKESLNADEKSTLMGLISSIAVIDQDKAEFLMEQYKEKYGEQDPTKDPNDIRLYEYYANQEREAGRPVKSFEEWSLSDKKAGATTITIDGKERQATPYEQELDKLAGNIVFDWTAGGGRSRMKQNVSEFRRVQKGLESGKIDTKTIGDYIPFVSDEVRKIFNEPAAEAVNDMRSIAYQVLRETLGAQFTEKEGERLVATYFDPKLSEEANIKRMKRLGDLTEQLVNDKDRLAEYMDKNRTAIGFKGILDDPMQKIRDLVNDAGKGESSGGYTEGQTATNPSTGETLVYRNGEWGPAE